jgi:hypothetical protein
MRKLQWRNPERNNDGQERKAKEGGVIIIILHGALIIPWDAGGSGGRERGREAGRKRMECKQLKGIADHHG